MSQYVQVGRVKDAHGIKGEIFIILFAGEAVWLEKLKEVRLFPKERKGTVGESSEHKVFQVKSARLHKNGLIVKSSDIPDRNMAESLKGMFLEIPRDFLVSAPGEDLYLSEIEGFMVVTKHKGEVGPITAFSSNGFQDLLVVTTAWGEFEIPFVKEFVESIDYDGKKLHLNLPLGLLGELDDEETEPESEAVAEDEEDEE